MPRAQEERYGTPGRSNADLLNLAGGRGVLVSLLINR